MPKVPNGGYLKKVLLIITDCLTKENCIGAYRQKRINLDSPLWLRWRLDQRVITSRETPIEVH